MEALKLTAMTGNHMSAGTTRSNGLELGLNPRLQSFQFALFSQFLGYRNHCLSSQTTRMFGVPSWLRPISRRSYDTCPGSRGKIAGSLTSPGEWAVVDRRVG